MTFTTIRRGRAPPTAVPITPLPPVGAPTPLLQHLAGRLANHVAGLWPAPHASFVTAPAERRHLVLVALTRANARPLPVAADRLLTAALKTAIAEGVPSAPAGLKRVLSRLGETGWAAEDYKRLLWVLSFGDASKDVRHAETLTAERIRALACLPEPLLRGRVGAWGLDEPGARLAGAAFGMILKRFGHEAAAAAALRWSQAASPKALFEAIEDDLLPPVPAPPFPGTERLKPVTTRRDVRRVAARYENCVRDLIPRITFGRSALYEWTGNPTVCVELVNDDLFGWSLNEARLRRNDAVPAATREKIVAELKTMGVHVGVPGRQFQYALEAAQDGQAWFPHGADEVNWMFGG